MVWNEFTRVKTALADAEHTEVTDTASERGDGHVEVSIQTSVHDDLADKAHNYIMQTIGKDAFPTEYIAIVATDDQRYELYTGDDTVLEADGDIVFTRDPVVNPGL